jgi:hypothetical protein
MKLKPIVIVGLDIEGKLRVTGDLNDKKMLLNALAEGIKLVVAHEKKIITTPELKILAN